MELQKKIIAILFGIAFVLILTNVVIDNFKVKPEKTVKEEVSTEQLEKRLNKALQTYGIKEYWVEKRNFKNSGSDSLKHRFLITLPGDLPHIEVLREFFILNNEEDVNVVSHEIKVDLQTVVDVYVNNVEKLKATFTTKADTLRNYPVLSFVLTGIENLDEEAREKILSTPYDIGVSVIPSVEGDGIRESCKLYSKPFFVWLNDNLEEPYLLESDALKSTLTKSIANITSNYSDATGYIIDNNSEVFNSVIFSFLRDSFAGRNSVIYSASRYKKLNSTSIEDLLSRIYFYARSANPGEKKIFLIGAENFLNIMEDINKLRKYGYKLKVYPLKEYM